RLRLAWQVIYDESGVLLRIVDRPLVTMNNQNFDAYGHTAKFLVSLGQASDTDVTFHYKTQAIDATSSDYTDVEGDATIPANQMSTYIQIPIVASRNAFKTPVSFKVNLSNPQNAEIQDASATGTINDEQFSIQQTETVTEGPDVTVTVCVTPYNASSEAPV